MSVPTLDVKENIFTVWWNSMARVNGKKRKRVWIDSQTEEEILRGIREAKDLSEYDNLCGRPHIFGRKKTI